ncbi:alpha/beta fold hydrolase [Mycolicibacterium baixiangningiae]|uniref:alpha/beta fold hydrolase n=1 Tax=Mycolicibacterium baixiangningiae TaxID=2761578 RepID=UPI00384D78E1
MRGNLLALCQRLVQSLRSSDSQAALVLLQAGLEDPELCEEIERTVGPTGARLPRAVIGAAVRRGELPQVVDLNVAVAGSGPAVILLHGFPQTHYMWRDVARELAARHTVIAADLRGYGDSGKPMERGPETYSRATSRDCWHISRPRTPSRKGFANVL